MRLDTFLSAPLGAAADQARALEAAGVDGAYTFEGPNDVFFPLVEAALATGLDLYPNVAIAFPRSPVHLAHQAWDLQALSAGRFALGLGTQVQAHVERRYSATWSKPVARMRELVAAIRAVFACWQDDGPLDFRGDFYALTLMPATFRPGALAWGPPPIWVGAMGPRMTAMVAEEADGLLVHPFMTAAYATEVMAPIVTAALDRTGRDRARFTVGVDAIVVAGRDEEELAAAEEGARWLLAFYGSTPAYRPVLDHLGQGELQTALHRLNREGRWDEMPGLIDDDLLGHLTLRGSPSEVGHQLVHRYEGFADRIAFTLPYAHETDLVAEIVQGARAAA